MLEKKVSRRGAILAGAAAVAAVTRPDRATRNEEATAPRGTVASSGPYRPVVTPDGATLPFRLVDGVKVFHLVAGPVDHEFAPGLTAQCWGYCGRVHGPTIEVVEGDHVRIYVTNRLPEATTVHWHGVFVPSGMDGVGGLSQKAIEPGETYRYEFTLRQHGTFMYHSHHDEMTQMAMGLMGMIVVHPRDQAAPPPDRDYVYMLGEWKVAPGTSRPDPNEMTEFNVLTLNGRVFPGTRSIVAAVGERVRIRFGNLSAMDHHPIHLHGFRFHVTATDGGDVPESARQPETTVLVPTGTTRTVEFVADVAGDWAMHCHMTHHVMTQMGHGVPNMIGVDPAGLDERIRRFLPDYMTMGQTGMGDMGEMGMEVPKNSLPMIGGRGPKGYITMGGMFTILKVRDRIAGDVDPGWYPSPDGETASAATPEQLTADGIDVGPTSR